MSEQKADFVPLADKLNKIKAESDDQTEKDIIDCLLSTEARHTLIGFYLAKGRRIKDQDAISNLKKHGFLK